MFFLEEIFQRDCVEVLINLILIDVLWLSFLKKLFVGNQSTFYIFCRRNLVCNAWVSACFVFNEYL